MPRITTSQGLHVCPNCSSQLVQPVEWEPVGDEAWSVLLRCPECEVFQAGVFGQPELDAYDLESGRDVNRQRIPHSGSGFSASPVAADGRI